MHHVTSSILDCAIVGDFFNFAPLVTDCSRRDREFFAMKNKNLMEVLLQSYVTCGLFNMLLGAHTCSPPSVLSRFFVRRSSIKLASPLLSLSLSHRYQANERFRQKTWKFIAFPLATMEKRVAICYESWLAFALRISMSLHVFFRWQNETQPIDKDCEQNNRKSLNEWRASSALSRLKFFLINF